MKFHLPIRIDLIGGWSDQPDWPLPAAVVNGAFGWDGQYPLTFDEAGQLHSQVHGIGTGLGISSIVAAGRRLLECGPQGDYVQHVLQWESEYGAKGGWQDQLGAVEPGFKLIESADHRDFKIRQRDDHPLLDHLVLFDTGLRRNSAEIGSRVRALMDAPGHFMGSLQTIVERARLVFASSNPLWCIEECLGAWRTLCRYVPEMHVEVPMSPRARGYKLCGAGGGGYGVAFARTPEDRAEVRDYLRARGFWAVVPELLPGARWEP